MPKTSPPQTVLGFDFGMKHIGVAIGQTITKTATPLTSLPAVDGVPDWQQLAALVVEWKVDAFVVGIPYNMDQSEQPITACARKFANKIAGRFSLPVFLVDERLTSVEAKRLVHDSDMKRKKAINIHAIAAQLIVKSWLESEQH